ncbi:glycosyltransferase family 1 protein [Stipitochalara longipes BDJ]|nr:glycosyltransferase family 1 protein [Stipitochalara longipes BDJ]
MGRYPKAPLPGYPENVAGVRVDNPDLAIHANVTGDGRIAIDLERRSSNFSPSLRNQIQAQINDIEAESSKPAPPPYEEQSQDGPVRKSKQLVPQFPPSPLNIVMHVVGSRGDVQPFIALGKVLKSTYKHRVRIATHPIFRSIVQENGLEFFSIGGDPHELMAFMVRSPGLLPSLDLLKGGDVVRHRKMVASMMEGCWRACIEEGDGVCNADKVGSESSPNQDPFVADVIVANPPSFAHVHCGQKLGVPVHLMFTMPWSATQAFPHPLANIKPSNCDLGLVNYVSYALVETLLWQTLGSLQNRFRKNILGLEPIRLAFGPRMFSRLKIPHTYCWSSSLIPKPQDWGSHISVAGFYFLNQGSGYTPDPALAAFLQAGPVPIYVGFGSIVIDEPEALTQIVFDALELTGVRAAVSKGWGGIGSQQLPRNIFLVGDVPHDWLFSRVSVVVHHGGAGTTAAAMAARKPSIIVPFFGDQFFWSETVHRAGVGAKSIPSKELTAQSLAAAILEMLQTAVRHRAEAIGELINSENGTDAGCDSLHQHTEAMCLKCSMAPHRVAVWKVKKKEIRLSAFAATVLLNARILLVQDLKLLRHIEYDLESGPWDPITGVVSSCLGMVSNMTKSLADVHTAVSRANEGCPVHGSIGQRSLSIAQGTIAGTSKGVGRILLAGFRSPFEVMLMAARGFHNVPALYGDKTVRPPERITGIVSGFEAIGKEIGYGLSDGISGLVSHPVDGARREGFAGFSKGLAIGLGGFVLKPIAAVWGIGGYTYEGVNKEMETLFGSSIKGHISLARLAQGGKEFNKASDDEILEIIKAWKGYEQE